MTDSQTDDVWGYSLSGRYILLNKKPTWYDKLILFCLHPMFWYVYFPVSLLVLRLLIELFNTVCNHSWSAYTSEDLLMTYDEMLELMDRMSKYYDTQ